MIIDTKRCLCDEDATMNTQQVVDSLLQLPKFRNLHKDKQDVVISDILEAPAHPLNPSLRKVIKPLPSINTDLELATGYDEWLDRDVERLIIRAAHTKPRTHN